MSLSLRNVALPNQRYPTANTGQTAKQTGNTNRTIQPSNFEFQMLRWMVDEEKHAELRAQLLLHCGLIASATAIRRDCMKPSVIC